MPGVASIKLYLVPLAPYKQFVLELLQQQLDQVFSGKTQRILDALICSDSPDWMQLIPRFDAVVAATAFGTFNPGDVVADPHQGINPGLWGWSPKTHNSARSLLLKGGPWIIEIPNPQASANVMAEYSFRQGQTLP